MRKKIKLEIFILLITFVTLVLSSLFYPQSQKAFAATGVDWTQATSAAGWSARFSHTSVVFDNKIWVMGGPIYHDVWYSTNGVNWTRATSAAGWSARRLHTSVVFDYKMWVMGGYDSSGNYKNDVWYSTSDY